MSEHKKIRGKCLEGSGWGVAPVTQHQPFQQCQYSATFGSCLLTVQPVGGMGMEEDRRSGDLIGFLRYLEK